MRSHTVEAISQLLQTAWSEGRTTLLDHEAFRLCEVAGLPIPTWRYVSLREPIPDLSVFPGDEIVVKGVAPELLHKTEMGAVRFVRAVQEAVERARQHMARVIGDSLEGVLLVERISYRTDFGLQMLLSARFDEAFGPVVAFGVGGVHTEFYHSVLAPGSSLAVRAADGLDHDGVRAMVAQTVCAPALRSELRGQVGEPVDMEMLGSLVLAVADTALSLSPLGRERGVYLRELEFNPVVVSSDNQLMLLDSLISVSEGRPIAPGRPLDKVGRLLEPESALVVGASASAVNPGHIILNNLQRGGGVPHDRIWCLHPKAEEIDGSRCFRTIAAVPEQVDMAIVTIPAGAGADQMVADMVAQRTAHAVTLISGGFGETSAGREMESELKQVIQRSHLESDGGVVVNGGNCLGIVSRPGGYNTFFLPPYKLRFTEAGAGNLASISQSGAYLVTQASNLENVVSPRYSISFGNQIDLTVSDYLAYLKDDDEVRVFCAYVEGFQPGDGIRFASEAREIVAGGRAVLLYKAGRSEEGSRAARSHTAAMAGDYEVTKEILRSAGVVVTESLDELEDLVKVFCLLDARRAHGLRVGVVSNAGFEATAAADNLCGLALAEFGPDTKGRLAVLLPEGIIDVHNPVDATPVTDSETFAAIIGTLLEDPGIDVVVASPVPPTPFLENLPAGPGHDEDIARPTSVPNRLISVFESTKKPMVVCVDSGPLYTPGVQMLEQAGIPCFRRIDRAMRALATYARFSSESQ